MKITVVIIEDEMRSARFLQKKLEEKNMECLTILPSVEKALLWFASHEHPVLIFSDIQLSDGLCFDIFDQIPIKSKIIFTTAYDQYSIQAFKHNSIDYLLKPIQQKELDFSIRQFLESQSASNNLGGLQEEFQQKSYKNVFLLKVGNHLKTVRTRDLAYVYVEHKMAYFRTFSNTKLASDFKLEYLKSNLNPDTYFQINRQLIVHFDAIEDILIHSNSRLKLKLNPEFQEEVFVSRERVKEFKEWLGANK